MTAALQTGLSFTISQSLLKLMSIESVITSSHLTLCCLLLLNLSQGYFYYVIEANRMRPSSAQKERIGLFFY